MELKKVNVKLRKMGLEVNLKRVKRIMKEKVNSLLPILEKMIINFLLPVLIEIKCKKIYQKNWQIIINDDNDDKHCNTCKDLQFF